MPLKNEHTPKKTAWQECLFDGECWGGGNEEGRCGWCTLYTCMKINNETC
jgi:hypothetical protein